jgi:hypothetical protein
MLALPWMRNENEIKKWIGIMFTKTLSPISNIKEYWREEDNGLIPAHSFGIKTGLGLTALHLPQP